MQIYIRILISDYPRLKIRVISVQKKQNADDTGAKATRIYTD